MSEVTEFWIKEYLEPYYPELVAPYREAERIREAALESGYLSEGSISILLESARSARTLLGGTVSGMLGSCRVSGGVISTSFSKDKMETKGRQWIKENAIPGRE